MAANNPYSLTFGRIPRQYINRPAEANDIIEDLTADYPSQTAYILTGIRGCGKTVLLTEIENQLQEDDRWTVISLNPAIPDLVDSLARKLSRQKRLQTVFSNASIDLSAFGLGISLGNRAPVYDAESMIEEMLRSMDGHNRRLLVTIDEVSRTQQMRVFAGTFQNLMRRGLPIYLLMTGLYDNVTALQNINDLTFLYRAPKIMLSPLSTAQMARNYQDVLSLEEAAALYYARETKGYSFAFQSLGYYLWKYPADRKTALDSAISYVQSNSYRKIWSELSEQDQKFTRLIAESKTGRVSDILNAEGISNSQFSPYRRRLIDKGIIHGTKRGYVAFSLPWFQEYVMTEAE